MGASKKFAVFVDRDGTLVFDRHYLSDPEGLELIPTVAEGIRELNEKGIPVIVITNQSGIARGYFTEKRLQEIHDRLRKMLRDKGARIDDIFYCPHMPDAGCPCRKPATGMLMKAKEKHGLALEKSFVIGDRMLDVEMARRVGAKVVLVPEPGDQYKVDDEIRASRDKPDFRTSSFLDAVRWVLAEAEKNS